MPDDLLLIIPHELLILVLQLVDIASIFSLRATSKKYITNRIIKISFATQSPCDIRRSAAFHGHINLIEWFVHGKIVRYIAYLFEPAIQNGQLEVVKWLHQRGCPWDGNERGYASKYNQLEILQYLHENRCPRYGSSSMI